MQHGQVNAGRRDCNTKSSLWDAYWGDQSNHEWWERPAPEVIDLIESHSPESRPDVLDLGCGLGRHAVAFAQHGYHVTATDGSPQAVAHLRDWADRLSLDVATHVCDVLEQPFQDATFDIVVSYNVIYHGRRTSFTEAIAAVRRLLKPSGSFFFTCPSRKDGKYGHGRYIAPHTYASTNSVTPGDIHYFADRADLERMLAGFSVRSMRADEGYWNNKGTMQFYSNWQVLAERDKAH